jgi:hypothetical protein
LKRTTAFLGFLFANPRPVYTASARVVLTGAKDPGRRVPRKEAAVITGIVEKCCGSAPIAEPDVVGGSIRALRVDSVTASTFISRATGPRRRASTSERLNGSTTSLPQERGWISARRERARVV